MAAAEVLLHPDGGVYRTHAEGGRPELALTGLGERWELERISLRPWPVGARLQAVASVVLRLAAEQRLEPARVRGVRIAVSPGAYRLHGEMGWENRFRAKVSARYLTAVVLHDRRCWLDQFTAERVADPVLDAFARERVEVVEDPRLADSAASIEVRLADGATARASVEVPHGDEKDPLRRDEIIEKLRVASARLLGAARSDGIIDFVTSLDERPQVGPLLDLLRGQGAIPR